MLKFTHTHTHRSVQHVQAMSVFKAHKAPGEKPKLLRVYEQRMTNILVHMLICESHTQPHSYELA